jgi:hypothetical protein
MIPISQKSIMPKQKSVQQQSGDWAMTGKVPVARGRRPKSFCPQLSEG